MKTLTVKLKQHTPLIHFQHDQDGATLRASEVKPKLDRFVLTKLGNGDYKKGCDEAKKNKWLIGKGEHNALNYKLKVIVSNNERKEEYLIASYLSETKALPSLNKQRINYISPSPYFAQEKENGEIVKGKRKWNDIKCKGIKYEVINVEIFSLADSMIDYIAQFIQSFFVCENFGSRQNKGFGSYSVDELVLSDKDRKMQLNLQNDEKLLKENYAVCYKKVLKDPSLNSIFSTIVEDYKLLKSGKSKPYARSKLMLYGLESKKRWDKKFFKKQVNKEFDNEDGDPYVLLDKHKDKMINDNESYFYLRALLGLAGQYEFLLENPPEADNRNKLIISVDGGEVERFKSPIFIKVINGVLYLAANPIPKEILNKQFKFLVNIQGDEGYENEPIDVLSTPKQFDLIEFLDFAMNDKTLNYKKI
jgi:hypothetical protein